MPEKTSKILFPQNTPEKASASVKNHQWVSFHLAWIQWETPTVPRKQTWALGQTPGTGGEDALSIGVGQCLVLGP